jgi:hypothetical protein
MGHGSDTYISAVKHLNDEHAALLFRVLNDE